MANLHNFYVLNDISIYVQKSGKSPNGDLERLSESSKGFPNPPTSDFSSTPQANYVHFTFY